MSESNQLKKKKTTKKIKIWTVEGEPEPGSHIPTVESKENNDFF